MRWLIDGYNVIRRDPELLSRERMSLEAGRRALIDRLAPVARVGGDSFTVVFDGTGPGGSAGSGTGVRIVFSSARESADRVLARMAAQGGAVVSNDREVRRAAARAGAIAITADEFLGRLESGTRAGAGHRGKDQDSEEDIGGRSGSGPKKGNPRRLGKKARAAARALGRLGRG